MIKKIFKKKVNLLIFLLIALIIVLTGGLYLGYTKGYFSRFLPVSYMDFNVTNGKTNLSFSIHKKDEENYKAFLANLGVSESPQMSFQLDDQTTQFLSALSPQRLDIAFVGDKEITFHSEQLPGLPGPLAGKSIRFATESATLAITYQDERNYVLDITEPGVLLREATKSGKLYASKEIGSVFPIASKIATMRISVDAAAVSGEVTLR